MNKRLVILLITSLFFIKANAQYYSTELYVLNNVEFENQKVKALYKKANSEEEAKRVLSEFVKTEFHYLSDSGLIGEIVKIDLVKAAYYSLIENHKTSLENSISAERLALKQGKNLLAELATLLQSSVYFKMNSYKNVAQTTLKNSTNKEIYFQQKFIRAISFSANNDFENCNKTCEEIFEVKNHIANYDYLQGLKFYCVNLEKQQNYARSLVASERIDSLLKLMNKQEFSTAVNSKIFYKEEITAKGFSSKLLMEEIIAKNNKGFLLLKLLKLNEAEIVFKEAIALVKKIALKSLQQQIEKNIGLTYTLLKEYDKAESYYKDAQQISEEQKNNRQISELYCIRAKNQYLTGNLSAAKNLCNQSVDIAKLEHNYAQLAESYSVLAEINAYVGDIQTANVYAKLAQENADLAKTQQNKKDYESIANNVKEDVYNTVYAREKAELELIQLKLESTQRQQELELIKKDNFLKEANLKSELLQKEKAQQALSLITKQLESEKQLKELDQVKKEKQIKELENENNQEKIFFLNTQRIFDKEKSEAQKKEIALTKEKEKTLRIFLFTAFIIMILISFLLYRNIKQNKIIRTTHAALQKTTDELQFTNYALEDTIKEVQEQKQVIEEKTKQIIDSINYAKRIQSSFLPTEAEIKHLFTDSFILYLPKDIVSGDFYYIKKLTETKIIAIVADCTGHGVPGSMISMLGFEALNFAIQNSIWQPKRILEHLDSKINNLLNKGNSYMSDGMDVSIALIDYDTNEITFSGARGIGYMLTNKEGQELKGGRKSIGERESVLSEFEEVTFPFSKNTRLYLYSDGFQDQMNGETRKKIGSRHLKEKILETEGTDMTEQKQALLKYFTGHRGDMFQVDDVTIVGLEL